MKAKTVRRIFVAAGVIAASGGAVLAAETVAVLPTVVVSAWPSLTEKHRLPQTTESIGADRIAESVNLVDSEDALKYLPSIFIRKRNYGDTQAVMATRTWGVNSSARSLVYADGVLLSALLANNNSIGAPRWGLVAPEEIERIDILYGPYSAAYPGNSMGAVAEIRTRMPKQFEASASLTEAWQNYDLYGTHRTFRSGQLSALIGGRSDNLSWRLSANHQDSHAQPLSYVTTSSALPLAGTSGGYATGSKLFGAAGATAASQIGNVLGASGLLHTRMDNAKLKAEAALEPAITATYTLGLWANNGHSDVQSYLTNGVGGAPTYANQAGFGTGYYDVRAQHSMHSLALKSDATGSWDWEAVATRYQFDTDLQRNPDVAASGAVFKTNGQVQRNDGSGWSTQDAKAIYRPQGSGGEHELSFGLHHDLYRLVTVKWNVAHWGSDNDSTSSNDRATAGAGKTETSALWLQNVWRWSPQFKATLGGRWETWRAYEGYNWSGGGGVVQPALHASNFSPKLSLAWDTRRNWLITGSVGKAVRFPTVSELYQIATVAGQTLNPNPNLRPENVLSTELAFEQFFKDGKLRLSLFREVVGAALVSQSSLLLVNATPTLQSVVVNVDKLRSQGIELAGQQENFAVRGLSWSGSITYVDSKIVSDPLWKSTNPLNSSATGKRAPYVPDWRATLVATYRINERLTTTVAARYSGRMYSTMDNSDGNPNVYQGFAGFFVADAKVSFKIDRHWSAAVGIDNLNNYKYFLFHPFPQRTLAAQLKYRY